MPNLRAKIKSKTAQIAVVGLGYVGLPLAALLARAGFQVTGLDIQKKKVELLNRGQNPVEGKEPGLQELIAEVVKNGCFRATTRLADIRQADIFFVAVETPVEPKTHQPDYTALKVALRTIGRSLKKGNLVIVESTIGPGTTDKVIAPTLERTSGHEAGEDFHLVHCPERVMPGRLLWKMTNHDRVVGGVTPESARLAIELYKNIVKGRLDITDATTAEVVKTAENAYRDVQIAFANELALICERVGADVYAVRELVNKSPERNVHRPGAGVGGHCIPKDPWLLIAGAGKNPHRVGELIMAARKINDSMPAHMAELVEQALAEQKRKLRGARISVLGYAYLEDSDDTRNSPSQVLVSLLQRRGAKVRIHDPYVAPFNTPLEKVIQGSEAIVVMVAHEQYRRLSLADLKKKVKLPVLVDGRHVFPKVKARKHGFIYRGVGNP